MWYDKCQGAWIRSLVFYCWNVFVLDHCFACSACLYGQAESESELRRRLQICHQGQAWLRFLTGTWAQTILNVLWCMHGWPDSGTCWLTVLFFQSFHQQMLWSARPSWTVRDWWRIPVQWKYWWHLRILPSWTGSSIRHISVRSAICRYFRNADTFFKKFPCLTHSQAREILYRHLF